MKRKLDFLSNFKYKRRCSIFKENGNTNFEVELPNSEEHVPLSGEKKLCTRDIEIQSTDKNIQAAAEADDMYTFKTLVESSSDDDIEDCSLVNETASTSGTGSSSSILSRSVKKDVNEFKIEVLKSMFKDLYTERQLSDVINDTNGLDHAITVLLGLQTDNKKGQSSSRLKYGEGKKSISAINVDDFSNSSDDSSCLSDSSNLNELMKQFPEFEKSELQGVLEANSFCLEDAIAALKSFASLGERNVSCKSKQRQKKLIDFDNVVDCVIINDSENNEVISDSGRDSTSMEAIMISDSDDISDNVNNIDDDNDLNCDLSHEEQDLCMSAADKDSVLSLLDSCDVEELVLVKTCSLMKAKKICSLRPFKDWNDMLSKIRRTKGVSEELVWECKTFVKERDKMNYLMKKCEMISKDIKTLFEMKSDSEELVTKQQYVTKEPSIVASGFKLKNYQLTGLNWLIAIHKQGLNGILADEMGLGKTIQAIVFLAHMIEQGKNGPHLIIVPSSTCDNWKRELDQWCPSIKYLHYAGSQAERAVLRDKILRETKHKFQVLITTYSMATSSSPDRVFLQKLEFHYAIFDEAHMLKNMKSQRYKQLLRIQPRRMLMLTGTPIQNNLLELMSLLTFVMPNMFTERIEGIKLLFGNKVKQNESAYQKEKVIQAKRIMEPFVLRRVKKDVLGDTMPAKHEHLTECEASIRHRKVYDEIFSSCFKVVHSGKTLAASVSLGLLMELRKAANHPLLIRSHYTDDMLSKMAQNYCKDHKDSEVKYVFEDMQVMSDFEIRRLCLEQNCLKDFRLPHELIMDCAKFTCLDSMLPEMKKKGDRILLFNQFTMMMDIVEVYLKTRGYKYLRFDGTISVDERQGLIDQFNNEKDIFIFILSTKAGGLGINLTSANVVIMYDSDYNPHNDKQAEDRCHRLGQTREVNVYRLICKDTIEKTILKLANDKIQLHEDISGSRNSEKEDVQGLVNAVFRSSKTKQEQK